MNKDQKAIVLEYISSISEDSLKNLSGQLAEKYAGDLALALNTLSRNEDVDLLLTSATSSSDFFYMIDCVKEIVQKECVKRDSRKR